ncbi:MAG: arylsulfatase [Armatimonadota bacterium]|nr:arylsulfatase [Armatimonadota bacterium]
MASETRAQPTEQEPPNIIFILADDLGYGDLGCYGQQIIQTPNIDRMAAEGLRYTDAYAGSTVCAPSRCCLMTGRDTGHAYVRGNARVPLPPEERTVAEYLKEIGYATGIVGKWGLGEPDTYGIPNRHGFDYWFGYLNQGRAHNYYIDYVWENEEKYPLPGNEGDGRETYSHDVIVEKGLDFIRRHRGEPFFLYFAVTLPHANNERGRETGDGMEVPDYGIYADRDWPSPQKGHAAMISRLDRDVGRVLDLLAELDIDQNTLVFFTSDNGPHKEGGADPAFFNSWGPLRGYKRDLYEGGIRVPMIARWPGRIEAGTESAYPWAFWDLPATVSELTGCACPEDIQGVSVAPTLFGGEGPQREVLYWEFQGGGRAASGKFKQAVRLGNMKAVREGMTRPTEVYDLERDIGETTDLAEERPEVVAHAEELFARWRTESEHFPRRDPGLNR